MNVIVSNKYQPMLESLDIDIIKSVNGEFDADEIISTFQNFFFQRMILDITAIKDYKDIKNIQKLSISLDMDKVILLLDDSAECNSNEFLSQLISMGIYNFTKNVDGIMYLYNNPNTYRDVAHIQQLETQSQQPVVGMTFIDVPSTAQAAVSQPEPVVTSTRIIGIKGVTKEAGATTLTYLMKQELEKNYTVEASETAKRDFAFFKGNNLHSVTANQIGMEVAKNKCQVVLIDLNNNEEIEQLCETVIRLIEPSIIKLNKLLVGDPKVLSKLSDKRIVLNKSLLSKGDIRDFEYETGLKVFYNVGPVNDRAKEVNDVNGLLVKLGFTKQKYTEE